MFNGVSDGISEYMHLDIFIRGNDIILKEKYLEAAEKHNKKIMNDPHFYDAGFDLFLPALDETEKRLFTSSAVNKVDFKVSCCAKIYKHNSDTSCRVRYTPFYTYARSSISKTNLRLVNNQGIIDAGYRGALIGVFSCEVEKEELENYTRLLQICAPNLIPIYVNVVDTFEELGPSTSRGEGGFGSTGL